MLFKKRREEGDPIISANVQKTQMNKKLKMDPNCGGKIQLFKVMMFGFIKEDKL